MYNWLIGIGSKNLWIVTHIPRGVSCFMQRNVFRKFDIFCLFSKGLREYAFTILNVHELYVDLGDSNRVCTFV